MNKAEKIQNTKLISNYGGAGSIIETNTNGALLISQYDLWPCFTNERAMIDIEDSRLLEFVKTQDQHYQGLKQLVEIPIGHVDKIYNPTEDEKNKMAKAKRFPTWYYCPRQNCRRLKTLDAWKGEWRNRFNNDDSFDEHTPSCPYCSERIGETRKYRRQPLQQVRFVMASLENGDIRDIPFGNLWDRTEVNGAWILRKSTRIDPVLPRLNLTYRKNPKSDGLSSIYIQNEDDNNNRTNKIYFSQIHSNYIISDGHAYKMDLRGSHSLYLPNIVKSIFIPLSEDFNNTPTDVEALNFQEFQFLTDDKNYVGENLNKLNLHVKRTPHRTRFITRISAVKRLKETSVLIYYTRLGQGEPRDWFDAKEQKVREMNAGKVLPFSKTDNITWMPAVEAYGEGILFELDLKDIVPDDRTKFTHTFCHVVMKELEFQCGYPLTSLKEKIFIDKDNDKGGFLIYTIAGSEGSYGGLVSLTDSDRIIKLIERGAERAKRCPNDPICMNEGDGHCFACLDLPETSCSKFNNDLNRKLFLNKYFSKD